MLEIRCKRRRKGEAYKKYQLWVGLLESVAALAALGLLELAVPSPDSLSRKSDHSSARLSLLARCSISDVSAFSDGVLGVLLNGDIGTLNDEVKEMPPGRARPACSFCSVIVEYLTHEFGLLSGLPSVQLSRAAINWSTWNFFGSERSSVRKCKKWLVTTCLFYWLA